MDVDQTALDQLQADYKRAVDEWVTAIRAEEALALLDHSVAKLDQWEGAHFREHKLHRKSTTGSGFTRTPCAAKSLRVLTHFLET